MAGIFVIGGTGLVGNALMRAWDRRGRRVVGATFHCHPCPHFSRLDMQDERAVRRVLESLVPEVVAVPAANPHVDYCERHPEETRRVNVAGTLALAAAAAEAGAPLVFFSSDYVFDGRKGVYKENDAVCPLNEYGRQKAEAEELVLAASSRNFVLRTAAAFGWQWEPKNFVLQVLGRLRAGAEVRAASDSRVTATYAENLAEVSVALSEKDRGGIFHVVGPDAASRHELAAMAAGCFGLDASLVRAASISDFKSPARRPKEAILLTDKVRSCVDVPLLGARQGLEHMRGFEPAWRAYAASHLPCMAARARA